MRNLQVRTGSRRAAQANPHFAARFSCPRGSILHITAIVALALACSLLAFAGCAAQTANDEGIGDLPSTPYSQSVDAPDQSPSSPSGASSFAASLPDADQSAAQTAQPITIEKSGWWAKDGYVHYGLMVQNPNDCAAANATVRATLFDGEGNELDSYDSTLALIGAEETVGFAGEAGDGLVPARVEFTIDPDSVTWKDGAAAGAPYVVKSFDEQDKLYFRYEIDGTIVNDTDSYGSGANPHVLLFDEAGDIAQCARAVGEARRRDAEHAPMGARHRGREPLQRLRYVRAILPHRGAHHAR